MFCAASCAAINVRTENFVHALLTYTHFWSRSRVFAVRMHSSTANLIQSTPTFRRRCISTGIYHTYTPWYAMWDSGTCKDCCICMYLQNAICIWNGCEFSARAASKQLLLLVNDNDKSLMHNNCENSIVIMTVVWFHYSLSGVAFPHSYSAAK